MQIPWMQEPWLEQVGSMHWPSSTLHSAPFHPARHTHRPFSYMPLPLHNTGHESANGTNADYTHVLGSTHMQTHTHAVLQYISWGTAVTYGEWGYALLSQQVRGFSKSSSSPCLPLFLSLAETHTHTHSWARLHTHTHTLQLIPHAVSIYSSTTWARLPRQPRNCRKSPPTSPHSLWTGRENNRENGRLGGRALGVYRMRVESRAISMQRWRAVWLM